MNKYGTILIVDDNAAILTAMRYLLDGTFEQVLTTTNPDVDQQVTIQGETARVTLRNKGKSVAPFLRLNLKGADGEQILPAIYSDNYITLMPGESATITIRWKAEDARGQEAHVEMTQL